MSRNMFIVGFAVLCLQSQSAAEIGGQGAIYYNYHAHSTPKQKDKSARGLIVMVSPKQDDAAYWVSLYCQRETPTGWVDVPARSVHRALYASPTRGYQGFARDVHLVDRSETAVLFLPHAVLDLPSGAVRIRATVRYFELRDGNAVLHHEQHLEEMTGTVEHRQEGAWFQGPFSQEVLFSTPAE